MAKGQIVLAVQAESTDSDRGLLRPMLDQLRRRYRRQPKRHLVDGGFNKNGDTEWAAMAGVKVYGPPMRSKHKTDPYAPRADDGPGVAAWRRRMKSPHGKGVLKRRGMGERSTPDSGNGVSTSSPFHWFAFANNILAGHRLGKAAA